MPSPKYRLKLTDRVQRNKELLSADMDGETVMMSIENGEYYGLDPIASRIWELIEKPLEVKQLLIVLINEYEVSRDECTKDTIEFLEQLLEKKLISLND